MNLFFTIYIAFILYLTIPICKIIWDDKLDNNLLYILFTNYLFIFILSIVYSPVNNLYLSIIVSLILMIASFLLIRKIKAIFGRYQILSLPYFCLTIFVFTNILVLI